MIKNILNFNNIKGAVSIGAAALMYFTPEHIDKIIESLLAAFGVSTFVFKEK